MNDNNTSTMALDSSTDLFDPIESDPSNNGESRIDSSQSGSTDNADQQQSQTRDNEKADNALTSQTDEASNKAQSQNKNDQNQTKKPLTNYEKRQQKFESMLTENKRILEEIRQAKAQVPQQQQAKSGEPQGQSEPVFVAQPTKPAYTREQIAKAYNDAKAAGDEETMQAAIDAKAEWDKYDTDLKFWKIENSQKVESFNKTLSDNWNKTLAKHPDLRNKDSELWKEADKIAKAFPEVINRRSADGHKVIADIAAMRLRDKSHASEVGALKEQVKKLTEQLNSTQKRIQPAGQGAAPIVSKPGEGKTALERLEAKLGV